MWRTVRAPGAVHIPMRQLSTSADQLPAGLRLTAPGESAGMHPTEPARQPDPRGLGGIRELSDRVAGSPGPKNYKWPPAGECDARHAPPDGYALCVSRPR